MHADRNSRTLPMPGTPAYWRAYRDGYALLAEVKAALDDFAAACERLDLHATVDAPEDDGAETEGGVGSWERAYVLIEAAWLHPFAARVMHARGLVPGSAFCVVHRCLS